MENHSLKARLRKSPKSVLIIYTVVAAFGTYSCMYAFRKPFAVAFFEDMSFLSVDYKIWLITAQVLGYTLSKFLGIKIISELRQSNRHFIILGFVAIAELALLLFAISPMPYNIIFLFVNGIPLGMIWGVVFSYLEGRRNTEILGAGLCISFIFSSGLVKSTGKWLMVNFEVDEFWMPFTTGMVYVLPLLLFVFMLNHIPEPDEKDQLERTKRTPMTAGDRLNMLREFGTGLILLIISYLILTAFRDFRDNFAAEIWELLGYGDSYKIFTMTEIPVSIGVLITISLLVLIKNNAQALLINHLIVIGGFIIIGCSSLAFVYGIIGPLPWMTMAGFGLYLGYVPFNSIFFDRMIAAFRSVGNVGFLIYIADSFGYLGSVGILFYKNFAQPDMTWISFFVNGSLIVSVFGISLMILSMLFFSKKHKKKSTDENILIAGYALPKGVTDRH